jgi:hypothetical protein
MNLSQLWASSPLLMKTQLVSIVYASSSMGNKSYLNQAFKNYRKTTSTDQLKCVVNIQHYTVKAAPTLHTILKCDLTTGENQVQIDSPIATLVRCEGCIFLCISEVKDIIVDSQHANHVVIKYLMEPTVFVSYQILYIIPANMEDDPDHKHDWQWTCK